MQMTIILESNGIKTNFKNCGEINDSNPCSNNTSAQMLNVGCITARFVHCTMVACTAHENELNFLDCPTCPF